MLCCFDHLRSGEVQIHLLSLICSMSSDRRGLKNSDWLTNFQVLATEWLGGVYRMMLTVDLDNVRLSELNYLEWLSMKAGNQVSSQEAMGRQSVYRESLRTFFPPPAMAPKSTNVYFNFLFNSR